jgi:hypothetical protein
MSFLTLGLNYLNDNHKQQDYFDAEMNNPGLQPEQEYEAKTYTVALEDQIRLMENDLSFVFGASYDYTNPQRPIMLKMYRIAQIPLILRPELFIIYQIIHLYTVQ